MSGAAGPDWVSQLGGAYNLNKVLSMLSITAQQPFALLGPRHVGVRQGSGFCFPARKSLDRLGRNADAVGLSDSAAGVRTPSSLRLWECGCFLPCFLQ